MSAHATSRADRRGSALLSTLGVCLGLTALLYATITVSMVEVKESRLTVEDVRVKYLAEAGFERGMQFLMDSIAKASAADPLRSLDELFDAEETNTVYLGEPVNFQSADQGAYTVNLTRESSTPTSMIVRVDATGYLPTAPAMLDEGEHVDDWHAVSVSVLLSVEPSEVFDYAYFINNWGWFYGSSIYANGNVRSNGQFDAAGYKPSVTGQPIYDSVDYSGGTVVLSGYNDDNGDGLQDGNDGGIYSGWDIVGAQNVMGEGGNPANQHDFEDTIPMPNLSDLTMYEEIATEQGGTISIGGVVMSDAVYGNDPTERKNMYLIGTKDDPIVIDGPVVIQGNLIIGGYVTGQGAIYCAENIFVPDSILYVDGPTTPRPADNSQATTEAWLTANQDKDFLGLFAAESVVVGNHVDSTWDKYVADWLASPMNRSDEDAGEDLIPNTIDGRDGKPGTADDDVLEDDGVWTVETYTKDDKMAGLIPPGTKIGDAIPGTGEDIDGDGEYDDAITVDDLDSTWHLNYGLWGGNMPKSGVHDFNLIGSMEANQLDAVIYTNHVFAHVVTGSDPAVINGALISRNESIVYGTPSYTFNYDCRLLGGAAGLLGFLLPKTVSEPVILRWSEPDTDPNFYEVVP